jgi:hypothetical protein
MLMKRREFIANVTIGGIGAFGQAYLLAHTLESYPFKILASPPGRFYYSVGWTLAFLAPLLSFGAALQLPLDSASLCYRHPGDGVSDSVLGALQDRVSFQRLLLRRSIHRLRFCRH